MSRRERKSRKSNTLSYKPDHYIVITDGEQTEPNYLQGLKESFNKNFQRNISIEFVKIKNYKEIFHKIKEIKAKSPHYEANIWLVMDKDRVPDFDKIIKRAEKENINTAYSVPCIEVWFMNYFNKNLIENESTSCINKFKTEFRNKTQSDYTKSNSDIYQKLITYGCEDTAMQKAETTLNRYDKNTLISAQYGTTRMHKLISKLKEDNNK